MPGWLMEWHLRAADHLRRAAQEMKRWNGMRLLMALPLVSTHLPPLL